MLKDSQIRSATICDPTGVRTRMPRYTTWHTTLRRSGPYKARPIQGTRSRRNQDRLRTTAVRTAGVIAGPTDRRHMSAVFLRQTAPNAVKATRKGLVGVMNHRLQAHLVEIIAPQSFPWTAKSSWFRTMRRTTHPQATRQRRPQQQIEQTAHTTVDYISAPTPVPQGAAQLRPPFVMT